MIRILAILLLMVQPVYAEPFSGPLLPSGGGPLEKWLTVMKQWNVEKQIRNHRFDEMVEASKALTGRAQLGKINQMVNLTIKPADENVDIWSSPLTTLERGFGDCEDYAILKFVLLLEAGIPPTRVRLVIVRDRYGDHAIVAVKCDDEWITMDNRRMLMLADNQLTNYTPLLLMDSNSVRRYQGR